MRQYKNTWFYISRSRLDRTDDFQKFCGSGLDCTQFYRIRTGLGQNNFTVHSSLVITPWQCCHRLLCKNHWFTKIFTRSEKNSLNSNSLRRKSQFCLKWFSYLLCHQKNLQSYARSSFIKINDIRFSESN